MKDDDRYEVIIRNLNKSYGKLSVFTDLSLNFLKDRITVVFGPSGCGKTTLLNIISGIEKDYNGEVYLQSNKISYVFQEDRLISHLDVYENVAFVLKSNMNKNKVQSTVNRFLNMVELWDCRDKFPRELSGGMKRRVALARAFAYDSDLLLMDEPFKGLDSRLKGDIINKFLLLYRENKRTVILVTHDKEEANKLGDIIYSLD
ncbi:MULTISPECIES: ABC transporter ATP-binding protein [Clostridium]|jgi:NitT/TauT family transport system ATP-binding protein|uniref:ABC transporter ATP-binding protein n=1 Tax=Clostridium lapidicellarium TaxID=3240931 RepID=A0ABV4DYL0_9CLOT|nr:ATP-binding cassette domain-containing protein [uncultured Clostridium sp.]NLU08210.1 ATP-binding cassette domain-containing protein [Clostridiales bacterium]